MEGIESVQAHESQEKPPVLYIGTHTAGIEEFTPRRGRVRDENEGPVIFATPDKALASAFLVEGHNDSWMQIGYFENVLVVVINNDRGQFIASDTGGVLYEVPSTTFDFDPHKGLREKEWTSREPVKPLSESPTPSALDAMIKEGAQVYFVDKATFEAIDAAADHGLQILIGRTSENEDRQEHVRSLSELRGEV